MTIFYSKSIFSCLALVMVLSFTTTNVSSESSSLNYKVKWEGLLGGGVTQSSSYNLAGEMVSNASSGHASSTSYQLIAGFTSPPDTDMDAVKDFMDNCIVVSNTDQRDTDSDGYGNACDPDLNQDGAVNFVDLGLLKAVFFTSNENADLNGDGAVNFLDLGLLKSMFFKPPGPSGIAP